MSTPYSDYGWVMLHRLRSRRPHAPWLMRSAQSHGPVYCFICDACQTITWTYSASDTTPTCSGGIYSRMPERASEAWE